MEDKLVIALIAFTGIVLGLLANSTSYFWQSRESKLKNRNAVLFQLLEIRHSIKVRSANPHIFYRKYIEYCDSYLLKNGVASSEVPDELKVIIQTHFKELVEGMSQDTCLNEINKSLNKSILELSEYDPIMAFKITGIDNAKLVFKSQQDYSNKFIELVQLEAEQSILKPVIKQLDDVYQMTVDAIFTDINKKIRIVAKACGKSKLKTVNKMIKRNPNVDIEFGDLNLEKFLDQLLTQLKAKEVVPVSE